MVAFFEGPGAVFVRYGAVSDPRFIADYLKTLNDLYHLGDCTIKKYQFTML